MLLLIVDSSPAIIERFEEILSEAENSMVIQRAVSYKEAKQLFNESRHDVVLLDIDLPGNESLKLLREMKNAGGETDVIILFTLVDNYVQEQCKYLGVDFFFDKYYDFEKIQRVLYAVSLTNARKRMREKG
jgi:DNA-binding NarL/FixJ family response regulator